MQTSKITIMAMTRKGLAVVRAIHSRYPGMLGLVIAARDRNMLDDCYDEIAEYCRNNKIPFADRERNPKIDSEFVLAISWRWLIAHVNSRLIIFHDSVLPRYRGFNPLVSALINGDRRIGVTAIFGSDDYDCGDIISSREVEINYPITIAEAIKVILPCYESLALEIAHKMDNNMEIRGYPQDDFNASYSLWRDESDYLINWHESSEKIRRFVDAVGFPYKGASSVVDGNVVRVLKVEEVPDVRIENRDPGKVIFMDKQKPIVVCGKGLVRIVKMVDEEGRQINELPRFRIRFVGR